MNSTVEKVVALAAAVAVVVVLLGACGSEPGSGSGEPAGAPRKGTVVLRDISFKPGKITIEAGESVTWRFEDQGISHDVVAKDESFKSEVTDSGTFRHTFDTPGTYDYICSLHPVQMKGTIVVR